MVSKRLESILTGCFRGYGDFVGSHPLIFIVLPFIATLFLAPGIYFLKYDDEVILLFTPKDAPARQELRAFNAFQTAEPLFDPNFTCNSNESGFSSNEFELLQYASKLATDNPWFFVGVAYENESNIMRQDTWREISKFMDFIYHNFTCKVHGDSEWKKEAPTRLLRYNPDFCDPENSFKCPPLDKYMHYISDLVKKSSSTSNMKSKIQLSYPVMHIFDRPINWGQFIYGAEINQTTGNLASAKILVLKLEFQFDSANIQEPMARQCMKQLIDFVYSYRSNSIADLRFYITSEWYQNDQVAITRTRLPPYIPLTAALVTVFTLISSIYRRSPIIGLIEGALGAFTIGLSLVASFGIIFACGVPFNFVITMTPFLTLCVGIDNDFLLMSAWRRPNAERLAPRQRLAQAFMDAGPNLAITSINDILCFAVGCLSDSPAVSDFCLFTCVALLIRFVYQLTFFSGILVYLNELDLNSWTNKAISALANVRKAVCTKNKPSMKSNDSFSDTKTIFDVSKIRKFLPQTDHTMHEFFEHTYSKFLARRSVRFVVTGFFLLYMCMAVFLSCTLTVNVDLQKLFYDDSPLIKFAGIVEKYVLKSQVGNVIVTEAPDFRHPSNVHRFLQFVDALENAGEYTPTNPRETSTLWLRDYLEFKSFISPDEDDGLDFYEYLRDFLQSTRDNARFLNDLRFKMINGTLALDAFRFTTYYVNVSTWDDSVKLMHHWRNVCRNFSDYSAIVQDYHFRNTYLDQRVMLPGNTLQTMGIASLMIALITFLLMPDAASMFFIWFSSLSVDLGVIGMLSIWGSDLDPVTMVCLLMTIGFSVYYTARICYCYQRVDRWRPLQEKLAYTLGAVGWPILQGGLATLIGIIPLGFVNGYMPKTFFRTIVLVVTIGLLHGLLFMPAVMSLYEFRIPAFRKRRKEGQLRGRFCS